MARAARKASQAPADESDPVVTAVQRRAQAQADAAAQALAAPQAKGGAKPKAKMKRPAATSPIDDETLSAASEGGSDSPLVKRHKIDGKQPATPAPMSCKSGGAPPVDQLGKVGKIKGKGKGKKGKGQDAVIQPSTVKLEPKLEAEGPASAPPLAMPVGPLPGAAAEAPAEAATFAAGPSSGTAAPPQRKAAPAAPKPAPAQPSDERAALSQGKMPKG
eukprot:4738367-Pyramimonas_sp.AAC.1